MRSRQSIQIPLRLDRNRKALMTQLSANIAKIAITTPKRCQLQQYDEWRDLDTLKKKQHIDVNALEDKKQNQKVKKQNDKNFCTQKQIPIKPNFITDCKFIHSTQKKTLQTHTQQEQLNSNFQLLKSTDFNSMLDHKIYNFDHFSYENSKIFSEKEKLLISIQEKLDDHLIFLKQNRKKKKGELFSTIKKTFLQNYRIFLDFSHLKKILYIDERLYSIQKFGEGISFECLMDINLLCKQSDQKELENELKRRKNEFRLKLFSYKQKFGKYSNQKGFDIPEIRFQFEEIMQNRKNVLKSSVKQLLDGQLIKKKKLDRFFVLQNKSSTIYEESKKILEKGMRKVESIIAKDNELNLGMFTNKIFQKRLLTEKQVKKIINEITVIYKDRNVFNMIEDQLIENLSKKMILAEGIIRKVVDIFLELSLQVSKQKPFLTPINHKLGRLIRINSGIVKEFEKCVLMNQSWMKMFEFDMEMNGDYLKQKMQEERDKLYNEIEKQEEQKNNSKLKPQSMDECSTLCEKKAVPSEIMDCTAKKTIKSIKNTDKRPYRQFEQESKIHSLDGEDEKSIRIHSICFQEQFLTIQKDDFRSTLSNSQQIFYEEENQLNQARS